MATPTVPTLPIHRLSVAQYEQMIRANILNETDGVELIHGLLVPKMSHGDDHDTSIERLTGALVPAVPPATAVVRCQCALTLPDSVPEPDFVVCTPARARAGRHPTPADTFLVMEVSDSTLYYDRTVKLGMYAGAGIPVYWIVNIPDRRIEVYTDPAATPPAYSTRTDYRPGQAVPLVVAGTAVAAIDVDAVLP
jgi:Uma2 family endonuclease